MPTKSLAYYLDIKYPVTVQEEPDGGFFVTNPDLDGCMAEGDTLQEALTNLADARELWIETRLADGYPVPEPVKEVYSGKMLLRMAPTLHSQLAHLARRQRISLNLLINTALARFAGGEDLLLAAMLELQQTLRQLPQGAETGFGLLELPAGGSEPSPVPRRS
jgi:predicted RNase H-like HicB family nuclease